MKTLIIYSSQTGFTKRYTEWLAEKLCAETMTVKEAHKKDDSYFKPYDAIIYGGWVAVEKIHKADWFLKRISKWEGKKLAIFGVGASPITYSGVDGLLKRALNDEQRKYVKAFYCEGGIDYSKMSMGSKVLMKTFVAMLKGKKNKTPDEKAMFEHISKSCDCSDPKYLEPIVDYINSPAETA
ncbi:MAG: flavodoxin domain-containing protein [Ruminococcus sp.]|uniref:flavodoxin domain-containing protein n=1 Tax=Ruminococcus sp. TaxID=41978 RepID=UPI0025DA85F8|nr:flavodoxin domain-containing protein [Ruminococcus sp.]MCR5601067.1 flavodoxin domain-containing protein [Ruminococcus sp.]